MHSSGALSGQELPLAGHTNGPINTWSRFASAQRLHSYLKHTGLQGLLTHKLAGLAWTLVVLSTVPAGARLRLLSFCPVLTALQAQRLQL